jgi:hypothetical protein
MLAALVNGERGGKWCSLMDKVYQPENPAFGLGGGTSK